MSSAHEQDDIQTFQPLYNHDQRLAADYLDQRLTTANHDHDDDLDSIGDASDLQYRAYRRDSAEPGPSTRLTQAERAAVNGGPRAAAAAAAAAAGHKYAPCSSKDQSRRSVDMPRKSVDTPRRSVDTPRRSVDMPRRSVDMPRRSVDTPRKSVDMPRRSVDMPRRSVEQGRVKKAKPRRQSRAERQEQAKLERKLERRRRVAKVIACVAVLLICLCFLLVGVTLAMGHKIDQMVPKNYDDASVDPESNDEHLTNTTEGAAASTQATA